MFGGLDVKGSGGGGGGAAAESKKEEASSPANSAFSFMTSSAPAAAAPAAPSGFSFLANGGTGITEAPAPAAGAAAPPAPASGFSFLSESPAPGPPPTTNEETPAATEAAADTATTDLSVAAPSAMTGSSFGFMSLPASADEGAAPPPLPEAAAATKPTDSGGASATSGFGFMTAAAPAETTRAPLANRRESEQSDVSGSAEPDLLSTTAPAIPAASAVAPVGSTSIPAGSGVSFGATAQKKTIKKKRSRTTAIGVGAASSPARASLPPPAAVVPAPAPAKPTTSPSQATREAASEATRRAEQFMKDKMQQAHAASAPPLHQPRTSHEQPVFRKESSGTTAQQQQRESGTISRSSADDAASPPAVVKAASSEDEVFAAARAAAVEAKQIQQQQQQRHHMTLGDRMGLTNLWGSRGGGGGGSGGPPSRHSSGSAVPAGSNHSRGPPAPTVAALPPAEEKRIPPPTAAASRSSSAPVSSASAGPSTTSAKTTTSASEPAPAPAPAPAPTPEPTPSSATPPSTTTTGASLTEAERLLKEQQDVQRAVAEQQEQMRKKEEKDPKVDAGSLLAGALTSNAYRGPVSVVPVPKPPGTGSKNVQLPSPERPRHTPGMQTFSLKNPAAPPTKTPPDPVTTMAKSSTARYHSMMKGFSEQVQACMQQVMEVREQRSELVQERFKATEARMSVMMQIPVAESQLEQAAESEDYELADRLEQVLQTLRKERKEQDVVLDKIAAAIEQLEEQKLQAVQAVSRHFSWIGKQLKDFQKEQDDAAEKNESSAAVLDRFSATAKQLSSENERLQQDWKHIERDADLVAEERKEVEDSIVEQAGEFQTLRDEAMARLAGVEEEIVNLRKQLQEKQERAAQLRTEAAGHEDAVCRVRVKFSRQLLRVEKKEATVNDHKEEWELERKSYESSKTAHDEAVKEHSEALLERDQLRETISEQVDLADTFETILSKEIGIDAASLVSQSESKDGEDGGKCTELKQDLAAGEAAVREAKQMWTAATSRMTTLQDECNQLETHIPVLEQEKKQAAAFRNFKLAGKISKAIKESTARLAECRGELEGEAKERVEATEKEFKREEASLNELREKAAAAEKESALGTMKRLADIIQRLMATKRSVCSQQDAEDHDGTRKDSSGSSIRVVGAYCLDLQIQALMNEGQTYGDKFGGWDELMENVVGPEEGTSTTKPDDEGKETSPDTNVTDGSGKEGESVDKESNAVVVDDQKPEHDEGKGDNDEVDVKDRMGTFCQLAKQIEETEESLQHVVEAEDYDEAARLDEILQDLTAKVQALNLTDEQKEEALRLDCTISSNEAGGEPEQAENGPTGETDDTGGKKTGVVEDEVDDDVVVVTANGVHG